MYPFKVSFPVFTVLLKKYHKRPFPGWDSVPPGSPPSGGEDMPKYLALRRRGLTPFRLKESPPSEGGSATASTIQENYFFSPVSLLVSKTGWCEILPVKLLDPFDSSRISLYGKERGPFAEIVYLL